MEYTSFYWQVIRALAEKYDADMDTPYKDLPKKFKEVLLYGTGDEKLSYVYTNRNGDTQNAKSYGSKASSIIWNGGIGKPSQS